ncbi:MAG: glycosyltransferase family 2 protein [Ruminococcaceae bacterium]|jgi:glycosyltransferase involved in cell wall biosynthesis|nr:glycosyltransferase family 2 protein [Oscillospiraceae bacterium]
MKPVLSVAVACYNVENYLNKGLSSYSDERFKNRLEVIVVNDGSKDSTLEIAREYENKYPEIFKIIDKENGGHGSAVNAALDAAEGKYFRIIDGDDWVNTDGLEKALSFMETADCDMIIDCKREVDMKTGDSVFFPLPVDITPDREYNFSEICNNESVFPNIMIHTATVKTSLLKENRVRVLEGVFYEDIEYIIKASVRAKTVVFKDIEVYQYLVGNDNQSVSLKNYVKRYSQHSLVTNELIRFAGEFGEKGAVRDYLYKRVALLINTNINISLLYNENRKEGKALAKQFRQSLKNKNPELFNATKNRYFSASVLNFLGIDYNKLTKIKNKLRRS